MSHQHNSSNIPVQVPLPKSLAAYAAAGDQEGSTDSLKTATSGLISSIFSHNKLSNANDAKEKSIQQQRNKDLIELFILLI